MSRRRGRPTATESARTERIWCRFTPDEKADLEARAEACGLSVSAYLRRRAFGTRVIAKTDDMQLRNLARLGGLVKLALSQDVPVVEDLRETLGEIRTAVAHLSGTRRS